MLAGTQQVWVGSLGFSLSAIDAIGADHSPGVTLSGERFAFSFNKHLIPSDVPDDLGKVMGSRKMVSCALVIAHSSGGRFYYDEGHKFALKVV